MKLLALAIVFAALVASFGEKARFDNYRVYSIRVENESQLEALKIFEGGLDGISFLETPTGIKQTAEILVPPHNFANIEDMFEALELENYVKIDDIQK